MTTATEHHDAQLAAIKANHERVRALFRDPEVTAIGLRDIRLDQLGIFTVYVDPIGRFWKVVVGDDGLKAEMVFDPDFPRAYEHYRARCKALTEAAASTSMIVDRHEGLVTALGGDPDDTQAAQGFPAKEG